MEVARANNGRRQSGQGFSGACRETRALAIEEKADDFGDVRRISLDALSWRPVA